MSPELNKRLCSRYPEITKNYGAGSHVSAMHHGFTCGDGWYGILDAMLGSIARYQKARHDAYEYARLHPVEWLSQRRRMGLPVEFPPLPEPFVLDQVKEKFGLLRVYYSGGDDYCRGVVAMAECMSGETCEECGRAGTITEDGWVKVRCLEHAKG